MGNNEKKEAFDKAKQFFDKFDVDDDKHAAVIILFDKEAKAIRMLTINANPGCTLMMLNNATDTFIESIESAMDIDRTLN